MSDDTGDAWIKAIMRNSNGESRGSVCLQRGERATFSNDGQAGYKYYLGMSKLYNTSGGVVYITGSWSPDTY